METKECKTCHAIKPINEFYKNSIRQLIEELKARGYSGELHITQKIKL